MLKSKVVLYEKEPKTGVANRESLRSTLSRPMNSNGANNAQQKASEELDSLATGSARIILDIKAVFPFNFFPDELIIDETKVSVHTKLFFYTKQVRSVVYSDIFNVVIHEGLFFAKLEIIDRYFSEQSIVIEFLKKKDAILARRIIQGMVIAKKEKIDLQALPIKDLIEKLDRIGKSR